MSAVTESGSFSLHVFFFFNTNSDLIVKTNQPNKTIKHQTTVEALQQLNDRSYDTMTKKY